MYTESVSHPFLRTQLEQLMLQIGEGSRRNCTKTRTSERYSLCWEMPGGGPDIITRGWSASGTPASTKLVRQSSQLARLSRRTTALSTNPGPRRASEREISGPLVALCASPQCVESDVSDACALLARVALDLSRFKRSRSVVRV